MFAEQDLIATLSVMEEIVRGVWIAAAKCFGHGYEISPLGNFRRLSLPEWINTETSFSANCLFDPKELKDLAAHLGCEVARDDVSELADSVIESIASRFDEPIFVGVFPSYLGGPAARWSDCPNFINRYELYINGIELGSAADQLTDLRDWMSRYEINLKNKLKTGIVPNHLNLPLLMDIESGVPQYSGFGVGIERVMTLAAGLNDVRDIQLFSD